MQVNVNFKENMEFTGLAHPGHQVVLDAGESAGGHNQGPKPSEILLMALGGCTGMDVISLLKKFGIEFQNFSMELDGQLAPEHPKAITDIQIIYKFKGDNLDPDKIWLAISKSLNKYSVVAHSLSAKITYELQVNGEKYIASKN